MEIEDLVQKIVQEVLRRLNRNDARQQVLILAKREDVNVAAILQQLDQQHQVVFWDQAETLSAPARTILPLLSCSQMADLALGRATDLKMKKALALLLAGKPIEVFEFEYLRFSTTAPATLFQLYQSYEEILHGFGLKRFAAEGQAGTRLNQRLICEQDIIEAHQQGVKILQIPSDAQLTPLAVDCARERGVQLQKNERRDK